MISVDCKQHPELSVVSSVMIDYFTKSRSISQRDLLKVRRVLFEPVDHEASEKFVKKELQKQMAFNSKRWNFDFEKEKMMDPKGLYVWKAEVKTRKPGCLKRKHEEAFDNSELYFNASTMCAKRKDVPEKTEEKLKKATSGVQRLMTDYLKARKHSTQEKKKKATNPVPIKKPRLTTS